MQECDIILKGGVASGVVYPRAIRQIAADYRFRGIGGTSAGAIAAAAAAAAEYGRQSGTNPSAFDQLEDLDGELARQGFIRTLFQPQAACIPLYWAVTSAAQGGTWSSRAWRAITGVTRGYAKAAREGSFRLGLAHVASSESFFGLCTGMPTSAGKSGEALTEWLHRWYQDLSGSKAPLTFADLERMAIRLRMVTTNVSCEQPITLPFPYAPSEERRRTFLASVSTRPLAFRRADFERLFPMDVVKWMVDFSETLTTRTSRRRSRLPDGFHWLPLGNDLPVLVAVRLSLSFPVLLTAIRLYGIRNGVYPRETGEQLREDDLEANWFSDGGVTNNLPIQFFDTWVPTRPTFAINLTGRPQVGRESSSEPIDHVWRVTTGVYVPPPVTALSSVFGLLAGIASTAQSSHDELQRGVPGYRERVVHVYLTQPEGGLNLDMDRDLILGMQDKGGLAGKCALEFGQTQPEHRWLRMLAVLGHLDIQGWRLVRALDELRTGVRSDTTLPEGVRPDESRTDGALLLAELRKIAEAGGGLPTEEGNVYGGHIDLMLESLATFVAAHHEVRLAERMHRPPGALRIVPEA